MREKKKFLGTSNFFCPTMFFKSCLLLMRQSEYLFTTTTVVPGVRKKVSDKSFQAAKHDESKALLYVQILAKAFAFEKTINQKFRKEFYKLKETMTHQLEDQKRGYERDIAKLSSEVQEDIATWKEKSAAAILNETTIVESRCKSLYEEAKNSLKTFQIYQKHRFDNTTAMIKTNAETYKSELNLRIQTVREGMQDNIDEHCIIPLSSTYASLNSTQSMIKDLSAKIGEALFRTFILACNQGLESELYSIYLHNTSETIPLDCYKRADGSSWARIYRWINGAKRDYNDEEYRKGFRRFGYDYWIGSENLLTLTMNRGLQMRVEMEDSSGTVHEATFEDLKVVKEESKYRVYFGKYSGSVRLSNCFANGTVPALVGNKCWQVYNWIPLTNCLLMGSEPVWHLWTLLPDCIRFPADNYVNSYTNVDIYIR